MLTGHLAPSTHIDGFRGASRTGDCEASSLFYDTIDGTRKLGETGSERNTAQEVRHEAFASGTLDRVPQSVVQIVGDLALAT